MTGTTVIRVIDLIVKPAQIKLLIKKIVFGVLGHRSREDGTSIVDDVRPGQWRPRGSAERGACRSAVRHGGRFHGSGFRSREGHVYHRRGPAQDSPGHGRDASKRHPDRHHEAYPLSRWFVRYHGDDNRRRRAASDVVPRQS